MGNTQSSLVNNPTEEGVFAYNPKCKQLMEDLFLVVENPDNLEQNPPYPMSLRSFPPSFWKYSIGYTHGKTYHRPQHSWNGNESTVTSCMSHPEQNGHATVRRTNSEPSYRHIVGPHDQPNSYQHPPSYSNSVSWKYRNNRDEENQLFNYLNVPLVLPDINKGSFGNYSLSHSGITTQLQTPRSAPQQDAFVGGHSSFKEETSLGQSTSINQMEIIVDNEVQIKEWNSHRFTPE